MPSTRWPEPRITEEGVGADGLLDGREDAGVVGVEVGREEFDEPGPVEPDQTLRVRPNGGTAGRGRATRDQRLHRLALVRHERRDEHESDHVGRIRSELGDDRATIRVTDDDRGAVLDREHLADGGHVILEGPQRDLHGGHLEPIRLQGLDDLVPARSVCPCPMDEHDVADFHLFPCPFTIGAPGTGLWLSPEAREITVDRAWSVREAVTALLAAQSNAR